jgi:transcriptional regulator with XRE-family HTH domain
MRFDEYWDRMRREAGKRLKDERVRLGYSQSDFADRLGVHRNTQRNYENGTREPDADYYKATVGLGVRLPYVINGANINELPSRAGQIAELVFQRYDAGFNPEAMRNLFFLLGLSQLDNETSVDGDGGLASVNTDALIEVAIGRGDVFNEAFGAVSSYALSLIQPDPDGLWNVTLYVELVFETISLYDEIKDKLAGLSLHDAVRLAAEGIIKNHGGMQVAS